MAPTESVSTSQHLLPPVGARIQWGQVATGAAAILVIGLLGWFLSRSQNVLWGEIPRYLVDPRILRGVVLTLELTGGDGLWRRRRRRARRDGDEP